VGVRAYIVVLLLAGCESVDGPGLFVGEVSGDNLAVADGFLYWTTQRDDGPLTVWRGTTDGAESQLLWSGPQGGRPHPGMAVRGGRVFWAGELEDDSAESGLFSVPIDGGEREVLITFPSTLSAGGLVADDRAVYVAAPSLVEVPIDGGPVKELALDSVRWIVRRETTLYFTTSMSRLLRLDLGTSQVTAIVPAGLERFDVDDEAAFVGIASSIIRAPFDGSATATIPVGFPRDIVRGPDALYTITDDGLVRVPLDGGPLELLRASTQLRSIVIDGTSLYFTECACLAEQVGTVGRIDLN
jgi:hypothetical protein